MVTGRMKDEKTSASVSVGLQGTNMQIFAVRAAPVQTGPGHVSQFVGLSRNMFLVEMNSDHLRCKFEPFVFLSSSSWRLHRTLRDSTHRFSGGCSSSGGGARWEPTVGLLATTADVDMWCD